MRFRIDVAYDGGDFGGWQVQPGRRTVQGELTALLARLGESARPTGSGRTDAGVHALLQPAHVDLKRAWDPEDLHRALASLAPPDLRVLEVRRAPDFHARFQAQFRTYHYAVGLTHNPFFRFRRWVPAGFPDPRNVARELAGFSGEVEAASLAKTGSDTATTRCRIYAAEWRPARDGAVFTVTADRFLYGMVRALVGTLVRAAGADGASPGLAEVLEQQDRAGAGEAAPAHGLYLARVEYGPERGTNEITLAQVAEVAGLGPLQTLEETAE